MRVVKLATVVGVTACVLGSGSAALGASTSQQGGKIQVFVTSAPSNQEPIVVTGAIGDYGTSVMQNANGKVNPNGGFVKVTLQHGGFIVNATALNKKLNSGKPTVNQSNCSIVFSGSGSTTIGDGTGAYAGITGTLKISYTFAGVAPKTAKGCNFNSNKVGGAYTSITGSGSVSF